MKPKHTKAGGIRVEDDRMTAKPCFEETCGEPQDQGFDPVATAKQVTAPLIASMREAFGKIDVSKFAR